MSKFTKSEIKKSFLKLLNTESFDRITVKSIVNDCEINRNTFYYYYKDVYALADEMMQEQVQKIVESCNRGTWSEGLMKAAEFVATNRKAVFHLHKSNKRNELEEYLNKVLYEVISEFVEKQAAEHIISVKDKDFISEFYTFALIGMLNKWLDNSMNEDINELVNKMSMMFEVNINNSIKLFSSH